MNLADCRLTVIGLGLMGGSLAMALKGRVRSIHGVDRRAEVAEKAVELGAVDEAGTDPAPALAACDLAVLAVPVRSCLDLIGRFGQDLPPPPRLLDLASTKTEVVRAMGRLPDAVDPLGGHPLCGKESAGLEAAEKSLYEGAAFALVPLQRTSDQLRALGNELVRALGGRSLEIGAVEHDFITALTSHVPYLLAAALVAGADRAERDGTPPDQLLASGFHDTSRLAASDVTMMLNILVTNRRNVLRQLDLVQSELVQLRDLLARGDDDELEIRLQAIRRQKMSVWSQPAPRREQHEA